MKLPARFDIHSPEAEQILALYSEGLGIKRENKAACTQELIGCTYAEFVAHIEAQFVEGMTWANHGRGESKWHIDHLIPCAAFDLTDKEQQRVCFHHANMRPMWASENIRKGAWHNGKCHRATTYANRGSFRKVNHEIGSEKCPIFADTALAGMSTDGG